MKSESDPKLVLIEDEELKINVEIDENESERRKGNSSRIDIRKIRARQAGKNTKKDKNVAAVREIIRQKLVDFERVSKLENSYKTAEGAYTYARRIIMEQVTQSLNLNNESLKMDVEQNDALKKSIEHLEKEVEDKKEELKLLKTPNFEISEEEVLKKEQDLLHYQEMKDKVLDETLREYEKVLKRRKYSVVKKRRILESEMYIKFMKKREELLGPRLPVDFMFCTLLNRNS